MQKIIGSCSSGPRAILPKSPRTKPSPIASMPEPWAPGTEIRAPHIVWGNSYVDITAVQAMQAVVDNKSPGQLDRAKQVLRELLADVPIKADEGKEAAE